MNVSERLAASAVVPVVVLDDAKDAVATAKALLAGGVDVMEITFRTAAAADSIKAVAENWDFEGSGRSDHHILIQYIKYTFYRFDCHFHHLFIWLSRCKVLKIQARLTKRIHKL